MHVDRFYKNETSGKRIYAILIEGEDCHDLENVGEGRARTENRWERSLYAELLVDYKEGRLEFIAFSRLSALTCSQGNYGLGRHKFIQEAAIAHLKAMGVWKEVSQIPRRKVNARHTVPPKVMGRR